MYINNVSLTSILVGLEGVLKLELNATDKVSRIIDDAVTRLEQELNTDITADLFKLQDEMQLSGNGPQKLLYDIQVNLSNLAFFIQLSMFHHALPVTLADVNYLGYARKVLLTSLKYLQDVNKYKMHRDEIINPLMNTLDNVNICSAKRLFIIMLMLDRLGVYEGAAIVAQLLYLGGRIS